MSPRRNNTIPVVSWPKTKEGKLYKGRVKHAQPEKATGCLHVTIQNLDPTQLDRIHEIDLPLPVHPGNRTCVFIQACGIDSLAVGAMVCLDRIVNAVVGMRFRGLGAGGTEQFDFEPISNPPTNSSKNRETPPS